MKKILAVTSIAFMLAGGAAFAQTDPAKPATDPAASDKLMSLDDPAVMAPFYTDNTMSAFRPDAEMAAAWKAMSADQQAAMKEQCKTTESVKAKEFCGKIETM
jgi:hypothetical protein